MMKEFVQVYLVSVIILTIPIYFLGAFINWDYNPDNWNFYIRGGLATFWFVCIVVTFVKAHETIKEEEKEEEE